jgi:hypothetical protein
MTMSGSRFGKAWALALGLGIGVAAVALSQPSFARENGAGLEDEPGGGTNGSSADNIPVGIVMVEQFFTNQFQVNAGPGAAGLGVAGHAPNSQAFVNANVFIFNPGWMFLGATTQFIFVQPFVAVGNGGNSNLTANGVFSGANDQLFKADAAWKFGDWHMKIALGAWAPGGTVQGPAGLNNVGLPFWTIQPEFVLSYEGDAWNLTAYTYWEIDTQNEVTHYQSAPIFHADFTATKTFGKWTIGPVADFWTQVGHDTSSTFYANTTLNGTCDGPIGFECLGAQDLSRWSVGGLVQYNFGPVTAQFWATDIVYSHATGSSLVGGLDPSAGVGGWAAWFQVSWALWSPTPVAAPVKSPLIYK